MIERVAELLRRLYDGVYERKNARDHFDGDARHGEMKKAEPSELKTIELNEHSKKVGRNIPLTDELGDRDVVVAGRRIDVVVVNKEEGK